MGQTILFLEWIMVAMNFEWILIGFIVKRLSDQLTLQNINPSTFTSIDNL